MANFLSQISLLYCYGIPIFHVIFEYFALDNNHHPFFFSFWEIPLHRIFNYNDQSSEKPSSAEVLRKHFLDQEKKKMSAIEDAIHLLPNKIRISLLWPLSLWNHDPTNEKLKQY